MKLDKFLSGRTDPPDEDEQKMLNYIREHVRKDFIDTVVSTGVVYRYTRHKINNVFITLPTRTNRMPMSTPRFLQDLLDDMFLKKFGWKPRSSGVFTNGNPSFLGIYGDMQLFFPVGNYDFIWSPDVGDLYHKVISIMGDLRVTNESDRNGMKKVADRFKIDELSIYRNTDLSAAIRSGNEIMFKCSGYVLVDGGYAKFLRGWLDE